MVKKKIRETIEKNNLINSGEHIVMGLSGGPDSVCLFYVLKELTEEMGFTLHAVHVNHGLRPGDAEKDQAYVEDLCRKNGISCTVEAFDCNAIAKEEGLTSEEAGRKVRYESFRKAAYRLMEKGVPKEKIKIAVAQNADDQAETVLLRLLRGTGPDGLAGMAYSRMEQDIYVVRPLLDTWRIDIEAYCRENGIEPRTDKTNLEPIYTRNKVRLQLIPYLQENFNPGIMEGLGRLSRIAGEDKAYLWQCAEKEYERLTIREGVLDQAGLTKLPQSVKYRVIMKAFQQQGLEQDISFAHLEAADRILSASGEGAKTAEFPDGCKMIVRYGEVVFLGSERKENTKYDLKVHIIDHTRNSDSKLAVFDYDKFKEANGDAAKIELRTRREGDFLPLGNGRKKIQNLFVDEKVPKEMRDKVQLAAMGNEILWIPMQPELGVKKTRYTSRYKLDENTKKTLMLEIICEM